MSSFFPDPSLHSHVVVPDLVLSHEGRLKIGYTVLHKHWSMALGAWYHATLAVMLKQRGFMIEPRGSNGLFQIANFPTKWMQAFSARTYEALAATRRADQTAAKVIGAQFRKTRLNFARYHADELSRQWLDFAGASGIETEQFAPARSGVIAEAVDADAMKDLVEATLTVASETDAVLQKQHICRAYAAQIVTKGVNVEPNLVDIEKILKRDLLEELAPSRAYAFLQWTAAANRKDETAVRDLAGKLAELPSEGRGVDSKVEKALMLLTGEQQDIARRLISTLSVWQSFRGRQDQAKPISCGPVIAAFHAAYGKGSVVACRSVATGLGAQRAPWRAGLFSCATVLSKMRCKKSPQS